MGKLTATQVKNAKLESKNYKLGDGGGLYLFITKTGRYWRYDYRYLNKRKTLALGVYPEVSLKEAREKHTEARKLLAEGIDPSLHRKRLKIARIASAKNSFEKLAWDWFGRQNWTEGHRRTVKGRLTNNIIPWIGDRPVNEITAQDVLTVCRRVESRRAIETAHRVKTICSHIFRYCVAIGIVESDPCRDLSGALTRVSPRHMATILEPRKIGELSKARTLASSIKMSAEGARTRKSAAATRLIVIVIWKLSTWRPCLSSLYD